MSVVAHLHNASTDRVTIERAALFLDLDGTLVAFADTPDAVRADDACVAMLRRAETALAGRLAVVSGRSIDGVDAVIGGAVANVAGVHGLQRRTARWSAVGDPPHPGVAVAAERLETLAETTPGLLVERKGLSVAMHYRGAPQAGEAVIEAAERLAAETGLTIQHGVLVVELRTPGADKGVALRRFMSHPPFDGARPIMIGDDLTDEAAFVEAQLLGGYGILVGPGRPTAALGRLDDPSAVCAWIESGLAAGAFDLEETRWAA